MRSILLIIIVCHLRNIYGFECPDLPSGYLPIKSEVKCYAVRYLSESERTFDQAADICKNELTNGKLADLEGEALFTFQQTCVEFVKSHTDIVRGFKLTEGTQTYDLPGFFFDIRSHKTPSGDIFYTWPSGRIMTENIHGDKGELLVAATNEITEKSHFVSPSPTDVVANALCEVPAVLDCGPTPPGYISFRTNTGCFLLAPLPENSRTYLHGLAACRNVPNTDILSWSSSGDLFIQSFVEAVNNHLASFDKISTSNGDFPGFYIAEIGLLPHRDKSGVLVGQLFPSFQQNLAPMTGVICSKRLGSAIDDPHIQHFLEKHGKYLCYDLVGQTDDKFILYEGRLSKVVIAGQLRDDYYFGKVIIQSPFYNETIDANKEWNTGEILKNNKMEISCVNSNEIIITIYNDRLSKFRIIRSKNSAGLRYLNVQILKINYATAKGIFGDVQKKTYKFFNNVQEGTMASISIEGKIFQATKLQNNDSGCWKISQTAAFYPKSTRYYTL